MILSKSKHVIIYTVIKYSFECLATLSVVISSLFLNFPLTHVVCDIVVHIHKNSFYVCVGGNHFVLESQTKVILLEKHET